MIAKPEPHLDEPTLVRLLDDQLGDEQCLLAHDHLESCGHCRQQLESLAGEPQWWDETISKLSDSTGETVRVSSVENESLDSSLEWIRPLLKPGEEGQLGCIDQYPIEGVIGQGGMGVVLKGRDPALGRPVAIKILAPHLAGVGAARKRFTREAQAAAAVVHPTVMPIYGIETSTRLPYIVMPFVGGGNLQETINREGPLDLIRVLQIGIQVAEGLAAAHEQGLIHRDIKPANLLVEHGNGRVLISDFGLARALDDATLTMSGIICGTPQFMSSEQALGEEIDARSDLFSLGSLLYALSTGRPPYRADSPVAVLRKISDAKPRSPHYINERLPKWFSELVARLMHTDRIKRIQTAELAAQELKTALQFARNPNQARECGPFHKGKSWPVSIAAAFVVCLGLAFAFRSGGDSPEQVDTTADVVAPPVNRPNLRSATIGIDESWAGQRVDSDLQVIEGQLSSLEAELTPPESQVPTARAAP